MFSILVFLQIILALWVKGTPQVQAIPLGHTLQDQDTHHLVHYMLEVSVTLLKIFLVLRLAICMYSSVLFVNLTQVKHFPAFCSDCSTCNLHVF